MFSDHDIAAASTRSSEVLPDLPDFATYRLGPLRNQPRHIDPPRSQPADMATPQPLFEQPAGIAAAANPDLEAQTPTPEAHASDNKQFQGVPQVGATPPRHQSTARSRRPSNASHMEGSQFPRLEFEFGDDNQSQAPPPQRHPSRQQVMRWGPPPTEYDEYERPYYPRPPHEYGRPMRTNTLRSGRTTGAGDYWGEDADYYNRPHRRMGSLRESDEWRSQVGGGGRGPPSRRGPPYSEYEDDPDDDERPLRRRGYRKPPSEKSSSPPPEIIYRLPFTEWMNKSVKAHFVATLGEFMGTTMFLFFAFAGTQVANIGSSGNQDQTTTNASTGFSPIVLLYISLSFGFSLMVNVWVFFRISGGLFNPAVTLAMVIVQGVGVVRAVLLVGAQICGAIFSSYIVSVLFPTTFNVRTTLSDGTSVVRGVFIEALLTAELVFTIYMLANEKHKATFMAPIGIGLALFIAEMVGVYYTGGSLNPARSFGPCVISGVWDSEHWIYWIGPCAGAFIAFGFYRFIKMLEYEMANPGQESASKEEAAAEAAEMTPKKESV
ncbi:hypothetical protein AC578_3926 [Pseudocercospora eumusae]|uniref:Aquaporin n=1 Tax=Pseudocercospora eumusae TaxID=321146 RepID=A0A139GXM1_9PEZI|nr:hypothetical protein AC578_3926 [Pseudocercospora eumusae]